jgi:hypothetical protein
MTRPGWAVRLACRAVLDTNAGMTINIISDNRRRNITYTSDRTFRSRGIGARTPPSEGEVAGYGGSGSKFRGKIPGSVDALLIAKKKLSYDVQKREEEEVLTVASMSEITINAKYAPTAATAGLSLCHHQTAVVPNHTPAMDKMRRNVAMNAHGVSPPVSIRPLNAKRFREGCNWYFRTSFPVAGSVTGMAVSGGLREGGVGINEGSGEGEEGDASAELRR